MVLVLKFLVYNALRRIASARLGCRTIHGMRIRRRDKSKDCRAACMTNGKQLAALFRIAAVRRFVCNAGGVAWSGRVARFMASLVLAWGLWAPHALSAANLPQGLLPQGGLDFPLDNQGRVLTSLRRSFPQSRDLPLGPSLATARRAALRLPFVMALASERQTDSGPASSRGSYMLHGLFPPDLAVWILDTANDAVCLARTGRTRQEESVYGTAFPVTDVVAVVGCGRLAGPFLAVVGPDRSDYRRVVARPVHDRKLVRRLQDRARRAGFMLEGPQSLPGASDASLARLPLVRAARLPGTSKPTYILTYGGQDAGRPASLVIVRQGRASQIWLGCDVLPRFFRLGGYFFFAWDYQDCESGRRGTYVYLLNGRIPVPVHVNADLSG